MERERERVQKLKLWEVEELVMATIELEAFEKNKEPRD